MATTEDAVVDAVRDAVTALGYSEAIGFDFSKQPTTALDKAFVVSYKADTPVGGFNYSEEARGLVSVQLARVITGDHQVTRRTCWQDARDIVNAIIRDGAESGVYAAEDAGRQSAVDSPKGANHLVVTVTLPVNFEAEL